MSFFCAVEFDHSGSYLGIAASDIRWGLLWYTMLGINWYRSSLW